VLEAEGREEFFCRRGKGERNYLAGLDWQVRVSGARRSGVGSGVEGSLLPIVVRVAGAWSIVEVEGGALGYVSSGWCKLSVTAGVVAGARKFVVEYRSARAAMNFSKI